MGWVPYKLSARAICVCLQMCPGDSTHFELKQGVGYRDVMVYHPGTLDDAVKEDTDAARFWAGLGTGRVMTPLT